MKTDIVIRAFEPDDATQIKEIYLKANATILAPDFLTKPFNDHVQAGLAAEICRIADFYCERRGGFWVAAAGNRIVGMVGLTSSPPADPQAMELRRMYVDPDFHRQGVGQSLLEFAEEECRSRGISRLELSTSELHTAALSFYEKAGFHLVREQSVEIAGGSARTFYLAKPLTAQ